VAFGSGWTWNVGLFIGSAFKDLPLRHDLLLHQTVDSSVNSGIDPNSLLPPGFSASSYWHCVVPRSHVLSRSTNPKYLSPPATDLGITFLNATCRAPPLCVDCLDAPPSAPRTLLAAGTDRSGHCTRLPIVRGELQYPIQSRQSRGTLPQATFHNGQVHSCGKLRWIVIESLLPQTRSFLVMTRPRFQQCQVACRQRAIGIRLERHLILLSGIRPLALQLFQKA
jgi:hypothetical protein